MEVRIIQTSDGSHSLLNTGMNETYHSIHGALQESVHVFITNGLEHHIAQKEKLVLNILEIGLGTGLNALLTMDVAERVQRTFRYTSLEPFPVSTDIARSLNYPDHIMLPDAVKKFEAIHTSSWGEEAEVTDYFLLRKVQESIQEVSLPESVFDVVYFDAFAPSKQPEMWDHSVLAKIEKAMASGAVWVTYCAKGQLKRDLKSLGLQVETLPGAPGKKEMVRAYKP